MKTENDYVPLSPSDVQAIFDQAWDPFAIETAIKSAAAITAKRVNTYVFKTPREFRSHIQYVTANSLEDTITRLQKALDLIKKDGRILWHFPGVKDAVKNSYRKKPLRKGVRP